MLVQNVIINKEKLVKRIDNLDDAKCLQEDKNCELLLNFLIEGPMTFSDIKNAFKEINAKKSDKTIYGYLNRLKKADLVMEAGKRIITYSDSNIKSVTLYSRTARIFYIAIDIRDDRKMGEDYVKLLAQMTCQLMNYSSYDESCFSKYYEEFTKKKRIDVERINNIENPQILNIMASFDLRETKYIIDILCWLLFICDNPNVFTDLIKCFKK